MHLNTLTLLSPFSYNSAPQNAERAIVRAKEAEEERERREKEREVSFRDKHSADSLCLAFVAQFTYYKQTFSKVGTNIPGRSSVLKLRDDMSGQKEQSRKKIQAFPPLFQERKKLLQSRGKSTVALPFDNTLEVEDIGQLRQKLKRAKTSPATVRRDLGIEEDEERYELERPRRQRAPPVAPRQQRLTPLLVPPPMGFAVDDGDDEADFVDGTETRF